MFYYSYTYDKNRLIKFRRRDETIKGDRYTWVQVNSPDDIVVQVALRGTVSLGYIAELNDFLSHYNRTFADVCKVEGKRMRLNSSLLRPDVRIVYNKERKK